MDMGYHYTIHVAAYATKRIQLTHNCLANYEKPEFAPSSGGVHH